MARAPPLAAVRETSLFNHFLLGQERGNIFPRLLGAGFPSWKRVVLLDRDYVQREGLLGFASSGCS